MKVSFCKHILANRGCEEGSLEGELSGVISVFVMDIAVVIAEKKLR